MPEVCPRCESSEISLLPDRSGKCRRCNSAFMEPIVVDVVRPKPFDQIMMPSKTPAKAQQPDWRRSYEAKAVEPERPVAAKPTLTPYPAIPPIEAIKGVNWRYAVFYGLVMAIFMGVIWGLFAIATGYIFVLLAIAIGYAIAWAVKTGAGSINIGAIMLSVVLTLFAVFIGDIVALTVLTGASMFDVIAAYPAIMAVAPGDICLGYVFGLFGAFYAAWSLWRARTAARVRSLPPRIPSYSTATGTTIPHTGTSSASPGSSKPSATVLARTLTHARVQVVFPPPASHTLDVDYETMYGIMTVILDGVQISSGRVWGSKKIVEVPMQASSSGTIRVRGFGIAKPKIEIMDGSTLIVSC